MLLYRHDFLSEMDVSLSKGGSGTATVSEGTGKLSKVCNIVFKHSMSSFDIYI